MPAKIKDLAFGAALGLMTHSAAAQPQTPPLPEIYYFTAANDLLLHGRAGEALGIIQRNSCIMIRPDAREVRRMTDVQINTPDGSVKGKAARSQMTRIDTAMSAEQCNATLLPDPNGQRFRDQYRQVTPRPAPTPEWPEPRGFTVDRDLRIYGSAAATSPDAQLEILAGSCVVVSGPAQNGRYAAHVARRDRTQALDVFLDASGLTDRGPAARLGYYCAGTVRSIPPATPVPGQTNPPATDNRPQLSSQYFILNRTLPLYQRPTRQSADEGELGGGSCVRAFNTTANPAVTERDGFIQVRASMGPTIYAGWVPKDQVRPAPDTMTAGECRARYVSPASFGPRNPG